MSDIDIPIDPNATRQQAVDTVVEKISAGRGTPDRAEAVIPTPNLRVTINRETREATAEYQTPADEALAQARAALNPDDDILDNVSLEAAQLQLVERLKAAQSRLDEHRFTPDGTKVYAVNGRDREILEQTVADLATAAAEQKERYERALAARARKAEIAARNADAQRIGEAWVNGDPAKRAALDRALRDREAAHIADAMIRTSLGQLD